MTQLFWDFSEIFLGDFLRILFSFGSFLSQRGAPLMSCSHKNFRHILKGLPQKPQKVDIADYPNSKNALTLTHSDFMLPELIHDSLHVSETFSWRMAHKIFCVRKIVTFSHKLYRYAHENFGTGTTFEIYDPFKQSKHYMSIEMSQLKFDWIKVVPRVSLLLLPRLSLSFSHYRTRREERAWNIGMT